MLKAAAIRSLFRGLAILSTVLLTFVLLPTQSASAQEAASSLSTRPSPIEKAEAEGTALRLSLKDLTKLALQNNLDIAISDTNEELYQQKVFQTWGSYDPSLSLGLSLSSNKQPNTNLTNASTQGNFNKSDRAVWNFTFNQPIKTGGSLRATYNSNRNDSNSQSNLFTPQYSVTSSVQFTQPLRQNFRTDSIRTNIKLANLDLKTNDSQFKQKVTQTIASIQSQYWDLVSAMRDYEIKRNSVKLAEITLQDNRKKVQVGTLAPIEVTTAQANVASREVDLISSEERINNMENAIRALISSDRNSEVWRKMIVPTDTPEFQEHKVGLDQAIDTALKNRPELEQLAIKMQASTLKYQLNLNAQKWQVDLVGAFGTNSVSGPQATWDPFTGKEIVCPGSSKCITPDLIGGFGNANLVAFKGGFINWSVGFNITVPLRQRSVEAQLAQSLIDKKQLLLNQKSSEQQIQVEIRNAVQRLETNKKQVQTAGVSRQLAQEQLSGEEKRFEAGLSQNFLVLQRQQELANAQAVELQTLITYKKSIITLQQAMYTLLEANDFEIAKSNSSAVPNLK